MIIMKNYNVLRLNFDWSSFSGIINDMALDLTLFSNPIGGN